MRAKIRNVDLLRGFGGYLAFGFNSCATENRQSVHRGMESKQSRKPSGWDN